MSAEIALIDQKVDLLTENVTGINAELKKVNESLTHLIRIDGDIRRIEEKTDRIGLENDDHENRIRAMETKSGKLFERIVGHVISVSAGAVVVYVIMNGAH